MNSAVLRAFAVHMVSDVAERRDRLGHTVQRGRRRRELIDGERRRIPLSGNWIYYPPGNDRFRDSDASWRLTLAVQAFETIFRQERHTNRGANSWASAKVAELILTDGSPRLRARFMIGKRGPKPKPPKVARSILPKPFAHPRDDRDARFAELDRMIAASSKRQARAPRLPSNVERLAKIIRNQVGCFRREYSDMAQCFDFWLAQYRAWLLRDEEYLAEAVNVYREELQKCERERGANDEATLHARTVLGELLHWQGQYDEAKNCYVNALRSIERVGNNVENDDDATKDLIMLLCQQVARCEASEPPVPWYAPLQLRKMARTQS